jgi:lipopolysaccharide assembly protein A
MRILSFLIFLVILFLGISFAMLNAQPVIVNYYLGTSKPPLSLLLVLVLGIGALVGWITGLLVWLRLKAENLKLSHRVKIIEKELVQLRTQPIHET